MITIYHLDTSRSERIVWLMEELALPYRIEWFERQSNGAAPDVLKTLHPLGRAPIIGDGDTVLAESGAIVDYIIHRYADGRLAIPPSAENFARYLYWLHFAEGSLMSVLIVPLVLTRVPDATASPAGVRMLARMQQTLAYINAELADVPFFAGTAFSAADIMMTFPFTTMRLFLNYDLAPFKNILAYLRRIESRPAYQKAMTLAGPHVTK